MKKQNNKDINNANNKYEKSDEGNNSTKNDNNLNQKYYNKKGEYKKRINYFCNKSRFNLSNIKRL